MQRHSWVSCPIAIDLNATGGGELIYSSRIQDSSMPKLLKFQLLNKQVISTNMHA